MKKNLLLSVALVASFSSIAQPLVTGDNMNPTVSEKFYSHSCTKSGVTKGPSGANVYWDFHELKPIGVFEDSVVYQTPASTGVTSIPSGANLAVQMSNGWGYQFFVAASNGMYEIGDVRPGEDWIYSDPHSLMMYPMGMDTVRYDGYVKTQPVFGNTVSGLDSMFGDGYGTLRLPTRNYDSVVRVHIVSYFTITTAYPSTPSTVSGRKEEYRWYAPRDNFHNPVLVITYDNNSNGTPSGVYFYTKQYIETAVTDANSYVGGVELSPNPAKELIHLSFDVKNSCNVRVSAIDMLGRVAGTVKAESVSQGNADISYDVSSLPAGMYIIKVETPSGAVQKKVMVAK